MAYNIIDHISVHCFVQHIYHDHATAAKSILNIITQLHSVFCCLFVCTLRFACHPPVLSLRKTPMQHIIKFPR